MDGSAFKNQFIKPKREIKRYNLDRKTKMEMLKELNMIYCIRALKDLDTKDVGGY